jgi:hypothetical protein
MILPCLCDVCESKTCDCICHQINEYEDIEEDGNDDEGEDEGSTGDSVGDTVGNCVVLGSDSCYNN